MAEHRGRDSLSRLEYRGRMEQLHWTLGAINNGRGYDMSSTELTEE